jgi:hypothetical protein
VIHIGMGTRARTLGLVLTASVLLCGCVSTVAGTALRAQNARAADVPPLKESALDGVQLSIDQLNGIVGSTRMEVTKEFNGMTDHSDKVSDPDCLGTIFNAEEPVYAGSGWTAMRDQVAREPDEDNDHWVEQTAVLYPSADKAQKFFDKSRSAWERCAGTSISIGAVDSSSVWNIDDLADQGNLITQMTTQEHAKGWTCQHALSVASNLTVEACACGYSITDEGAIIAGEMITNAAKK